MADGAKLDPMARGNPRTAPDEAERLADARRRLLADWCRLLGQRLKEDPASAAPSTVPVANVPATDAPAPHPLTGDAPGPSPLDGVRLTPRSRQILDRLLHGDAEKQVAARLGISPHTVHTYVKQLHKTLGVSSRGELLARFVGSTPRTPRS
jgi:DNA-binding CsgD family transcriptional regulator